MLLSIPNRLASSRCVARTLRSLSNTYQSLCKSSNDFNRSSLAFQERPTRNYVSELLQVCYTTANMVVNEGSPSFQKQACRTFWLCLVWSLLCRSWEPCQCILFFLYFLSFHHHFFSLQPLVLVLLPVQVCSGRLAPFSKNCCRPFTAGVEVCCVDTRRVC